MENQLIWLASYPKSGNTWFRAFLTALTSGKEVDINQLETGGIYSSRSWIENELDVESDYLTKDEIERFQLLAFKAYGDSLDKPTFMKIHDAYTYFESTGQPKIYSENTRMAVYLLRNPLDVTLSLANHSNISIEVCVEKYMTNPKAAFMLKKNRGGNQFYQPLGLWTNHVKSWKDVRAFPVHVVRYEDMKFNGLDTFFGAVQAMGLPYTREQVQIAMEKVAFDKLKKKEEENGFRERHNPAGVFFHKGEVGRWKKELTEEQIEAVRKANEPMMREFGYW
jgi:hypothetical protein